MTRQTLQTQVNQLPRARWAHIPTPLEELPNLSRQLGIRLLIKRDDCTGLALGGNKARQLEFSFGDALAQGADCVVHGAASQSNHCRQCAAAAAKLGLACFLVLRRDAYSTPVQGNLLLDYLLGAHVQLVDAAMGAELEQAKVQFGETLKAQGRKPYVFAGMRYTALSACAYVEGFIEILDQCDAQGVRPDALYVCSAGATGAGLALAAKALNAPFPVVSIAPIRWGYDTRERMAHIANMAAEFLGIATRLTAEDIHFTEDYVGEEYGKVTKECLEALKLMARQEGILLDPSYTSKAFAGLLDHVRSGRIAAGQTVIFLHTGGMPALFAYDKELEVF
ncbi:MAG: D-cysteine desulfhydrase family protein [Abditibacteriales bacterium]|nr:D-cysteine desulfhydrase family protein [Abditibacteriales bacterium]MDW8367822.1 D-cysteine desulfhydrase family protein [Abditibacteriales bacterium]